MLILIKRESVSTLMNIDQLPIFGKRKEGRLSKKCSFHLVTLFQVPHYDHLQILVCNGNSLTTLAGVENIKHLWKLDVGNNQVDIFTETDTCPIDDFDQFLDSKSATSLQIYCLRFIDSFQ